MSPKFFARRERGGLVDADRDQGRRVALTVEFDPLAAGLVQVAGENDAGDVYFFSALDW